MLSSINYLKQSTAVTLKLGPFVDPGDLVTPETTLTLTQSDVLLSKNGAAFAQKNDTGGGTHDTGGWYAIALNATDTNTLGRLQVSIQESGAAPLSAEFYIVPAAIWDAFFGSDPLPANIEQVNGDADSAARLALAAFMALPGTVDDAGMSPTTTQFDSDDITEATSDHFIGRHVIFLTGTLQYQARLITAYTLVSGRGRFTVEALTEAAANDDTFIIV